MARMYAGQMRKIRCATATKKDAMPLAFSRRKTKARKKPASKKKTSTASSPA